MASLAGAAAAAAHVHPTERSRARGAGAGAGAQGQGGAQQRPGWPPAMLAAVRQRPRRGAAAGRPGSGGQQPAARARDGRDRRSRRSPRVHANAVRFCRSFPRLSRSRARPAFRKGAHTTDWTCAWKTTRAGQGAQARCGGRPGRACPWRVTTRRRRVRWLSSSVDCWCHPAAPVPVSWGAAHGPPARRRQVPSCPVPGYRPLHQAGRQAGRPAAVGPPGFFTFHYCGE